VDQRIAAFLTGVPPSPRSNQTRSVTSSTASPSPCSSLLPSPRLITPFAS